MTFAEALTHVNGGGTVSLVGSKVHSLSLVETVDGRFYQAENVSSGYIKSYWTPNTEEMLSTNWCVTAGIVTEGVEQSD